MKSANLLRINGAQIAMLVIVNLFVGGMVGLERTVLPLVAQQDFGILGKSAAVSFIISFGVVKALSNLYAGRIADAIGRKRLLITGWLIGIPIPFLVMFAPSWGWIVFANILLGINQGFTWSMTVNMKIDLAGPKYGGLVVGLNEFAGYFAVSVTALLSGYIASAYGVRPQPFYLGVAYSLIGLFLSIFFIKNTKSAGTGGSSSPISLGKAFAITTWKNKQLFSASQAGFMTNFKDGMAWGLFPLFFTSQGLDLKSIGTIVAVYPGAWGLLQLVSGPLSDRIGRKWMISAGMFIQGVAILSIVSMHSFSSWLFGAFLLGLGTALVYPTLQAAVSDLAHAEWRASALGVYRFWRDFGYAAGALVAGLLADALGISSSMIVVGFMAVISSLITVSLLRETLAVKRS